MFRAAVAIASARNVLFIGPLRSPCPRRALLTQRRMTVKEPYLDEMLQAPGMKWFTPTIARPLLTNDHERDVHVTKRKISGGPQQRDRRGIPRIGG
jgi:hypothetical protein